MEQYFQDATEVFLLPIVSLITVVGHIKLGLDLEVVNWKNYVVQGNINIYTIYGESIHLQHLGKERPRKGCQSHN